jgi:thioredoxin 1
MTIRASLPLPLDKTYFLPKGGKMKRKTIILGSIGVAILAAAALFYFLYLGHPSRQALAHVNGEKITLEQFNKELAKMEVPLQEIYREDPSKFLDGMIIRELVLQEAKKQGLSAPVKTYKDAVTKDSLTPEEILISEFFKKKFSSPPEVTPKEIEEFYAVFKDQLGGKPLEQVAPMIEQLIREGKQKEELQEFLKEIRNSAKVEINEDRLKKIAAKPPESNTEEDLKKALTGGKPVLVDFGANSCIPCRQMRPLLKEVSKEHSEKAKVLVIDVSKYQNLAREYKIQLIPTLVFFDSKGKEAFRHVGPLDKEKIVAKLKEIGMGV